MKLLRLAAFHAELTLFSSQKLVNREAAAFRNLSKILVMFNLVRMATAGKRLSLLTPTTTKPPLNERI